MDKKCNCGEKTCDCVSREDYTQALRATAFLAEKVKILDEKYKLALLGSEKRFNKPEEDFTVETQGLSLKADKGAPLSNGKDQQIKITMLNPLPPGVNAGENIVMEDKDIVLDEEDDECPACGA
tara:strand:- start:8 stop:379 length:372 start_codon:yes stop_codon:yes gene_type:complete